MTTIKGPLKIRGIGQLVGDNADKIPIKLPFKATGWKSAKRPKNRLIGIDADTYQPATPIEEKPKPIVVPPEQKHKGFKQELIDLPKIGVKKAEHILTLATTKEGLGKIPRETLVHELGEEISKILDAYLGRVG